MSTDHQRRRPATTIGLGFALAGALTFGGLWAPDTEAADAADAPSGQACPPKSQPAADVPGDQLARDAAVTASYTAPWNRLTALTDGPSSFDPMVAQEKIWGTYASTGRAAQQWVEFSWGSERVVRGASVSFWQGAPPLPPGDAVHLPSAWVVQSWDGAAWVDVPQQGGGAYPVVADAASTVTFDSEVRTTRLRVLADAATNGTSFAAVAASEITVTGDPAPGRVSTEWLESEHFQVGVDRATGTLAELRNAQDGPECTNYVMDRAKHPRYDVDDSRWTGDVVLRADGRDMNTGLSDDIRTVTRPDADTVQVSYEGDSARAAGIRDLDLTQTFALTGEGGDHLDWDIEVANRGDQPTTLEDLGLPLLMNAWWEGGDQTGIYEQNVGRHSFVADDGSYMYWQRPNGEGPFLVMVPKDGTSLEFKDKPRRDEGLFSEVLPSFEGLVTYYTHSANAAPTRSGADRAAQYLPATSEEIAVGGSADVGFTFAWADDYSDMRDVLYDAGVVDVVSLPGMTIPQDLTATLAVRARDGIDAVLPGGGVDGAGDDAVVTPTGERNGYQLYDIAFPTLGENTITVEYGDGKKSVLQYYSTEPVDTVIDAQADFIVENQQVRDPSKGYDGAFLQWDMSTKSVVTRDSVADIALAPIPEFEKRWMTGGSDDIGLSPAAFLAEKNAHAPDADQVEALDYYIDQFLLGYLQNQFEDGERTWNIYHWYDGGDGDRPATGADDGSSSGVGDGLATWRVMNSPHVWNTYFGMYRVALADPELTERPAEEYLDMAWRTLEAYFEHDDARLFLPDASRDMASMGELTMPLIQEALVAEGRTADADQLETFMREKYEVFASKEYPFASEMSIDTTAFEANYTLAKKYGDDELARKVTLASLASRGTQPLWYFYGGDNRHMGESWWNLGYETQLGAWQQQDYLLNYDSEAQGIDAAETMRSTYGAYLAGWANVNSGQISADPANYGAASWQFQSEKGAAEYAWVPTLDGWWAWSGESALGFWGAMNTAAVNIVDDPVVGPYAYGADLEQTADGSHAFTPRDGLAQRINVLSAGNLGVELTDGRYSAAEIAADGSRIALTLEPVTGTEYEPTVALRNLTDGTWAVTGAGADQRVTVEGGTASLSLGTLSGEQQLTLQRIDESVPTLPAAGPTAGAAPGTTAGSGGVTPAGTLAGSGAVTPAAAGSRTALVSGSSPVRTASADRLARTGADSGLVLGIAITMLLAGAGALFGSRLRRP